MPFGAGFLYVKILQNQCVFFVTYSILSFCKSRCILISRGKGKHNKKMNELSYRRDGQKGKNMKAEYIGKVRDRNGYAVHLLYRYRGHEYMITDEHNGYSEPLWVKHKNEQERIDRAIEEAQKPKKEYRYEDTAEYGFNLFWEYVEGAGE